MAQFVEITPEGYRTSDPQSLENLTTTPSGSPPDISLPAVPLKSDDDGLSCELSQLEVGKINHPMTLPQKLTDHKTTDYNNITTGYTNITCDKTKVVLFLVDIFYGSLNPG